jgi:hypothetical protein
MGRRRGLGLVRALPRMCVPSDFLWQPRSFADDVVRPFLLDYLFHVRHVMAGHDEEERRIATNALVVRHADAHFFNAVRVAAFAKEAGAVVRAINARPQLANPLVHLAEEAFVDTNASCPLFVHESS